MCVVKRSTLLYCNDGCEGQFCKLKIDHCLTKTKANKMFSLPSYINNLL